MGSAASAAEHSSSSSGGATVSRYDQPLMTCQQTAPCNRSVHQKTASPRDLKAPTIYTDPTPQGQQGQKHEQSDKDMAYRQQPQNRGFYPPAGTLPQISPGHGLVNQPIQNPTYYNQTYNNPQTNYLQQISRSERPASARRSGSVGMELWDDARDMVLTRILSADEFLGRMEETDEKIRSWATCDENQQKVVRLKELLGLRGHLQDELIRIEAMLAEDDPELRCLDDFQAEFPQVVRRLHELHANSQRIRIQSTDIGLDHHAVTSTASTGTQMAPLLTGRDVAIQSGSQGHSVGTGEDGSEEISDQLRRKFVAEEEHIARDFAERFSGTDRRLEEADIDRMLEEHAIMMQALRKKQQLERDNYAKLLEVKKRDRLRQRGQNDRSQGSLPQAVKKGEAFYIDLTDDRPTTSAKYGSYSYNNNSYNNNSNNGYNNHNNGVQQGRAGDTAKDVGPSGLSRSNKKWFYVDMNGVCSTEPVTVSKDQPNRMASAPQRQTTFTKDTAHAIQRQATFIKDNSKPTASDERTDNKEVDQSADTNNDNNQEDYEDDFEEESDSSDEDNDELEGTLKNNLLSTLRKGNASKGELEEIMNNFREQEENRKSLKGAENEKLESKRVAMLSQKKNKNSTSSNEIETQTESVSVSSISTDTDSLYDTELQAVRKKDSELIETLMANQQSLSNEDFQKLLTQHLSEVERLRLQRAREQERLHEKLKAKLEERRSNSKQGADSQSSADEEESDETSLLIETARSVDDRIQRELTELDEKLEKELKRRGKNIDESDLAELLDHYRRQQESLLQKRKQEKENIQEKLKQKLNSKRNANINTGTQQEINSKDKEDSFLHELMRLHHTGDLTEEMVSDMLQDYLQKINKDKQKKRREDRRNMKEKLDRNAASTLVQEHEKQTKQIRGIRQREKDIMEERLRKKLQAKKNKAVDDR